MPLPDTAAFLADAADSVQGDGSVNDELPTARVHAQQQEQTLARLELEKTAAERALALLKTQHELDITRHELEQLRRRQSDAAALAPPAGPNLLPCLLDPSPRLHLKL